MTTPSETTRPGPQFLPARGVVTPPQQAKVRMNKGGASTVGMPIETRNMVKVPDFDVSRSKKEVPKPANEIRPSDFKITPRVDNPAPAINSPSPKSFTASGRTSLGMAPLGPVKTISGSVVEALSINGQLFGLNRSETYALAKAEEELTKRRSLKLGIITALEASRTIRRTAEQALLMTRRSHSVADEQLSDAPLPAVLPDQIPAVAYDYIVKGDLQTAKRYLRSGDIHASEEDYWAVWSELGNAYWERGHFVEAGRAYQTACDMFPERLISQFNMGTARLMASDFTGAMQCFKTADRIQPKDPKVLCNIAATHFLQHEYEQAEEVLFKTIAIRPEYVRALNTLAGVLGASKRLDKAIEVCDRVLLINPNHAEAAFKKGVIHLTKNEASEAVAPLELAMSSADLKFEAQCFMARTLSFLSKCEQAESFMSETAAAAGASDHVLISEAWKSIGIGWTATNEIIRSVEAFRKAADVSPKDPEICLDLGLAYSRTTQGETEAVKWFQAFLRLKSEHSRKATVTSFPSETASGKPLRTTKT